MTPAVRITATSPKGHRRAGVRHSTTPALHPPGTFTDEQIAALRDDPRLLVEVVGELAMGALTGPEIATVMADAFRDGTVLTGWEAHPVFPGAPPVSEPHAPESEAPTGIDAGDSSAVSTPAEPLPPDAEETSTDPTPTDEPAARPARTRKAKEA